MLAELVKLWQAFLNPDNARWLTHVQKVLESYFCGGFLGMGLTT